MRNTLSKTSRPPIPRFRRIQSMAGPVPWDARALRWLACRKRRWKAMGFRAPAKKEDFFDRRESRTPWLHFGDAFLLHGASARQDMLAAVDGLGFSRRDAARAMSLFYALTPQSAGDVGEWLRTSSARLLCPASGLEGCKAEQNGAPEPGSTAAELLEEAGQPEMLPRFLRAFSAQAGKVYGESEGGIAFIDSGAVEPETDLPPVPVFSFFDPLPQSRWLYAVRKGDGLPLGMAELRPSRDCGGLREALAGLAEAGLDASSCLVGMRRLDDPGLDLFYGEDGRLEIPWLCRVDAGDPVLRRALAGMDPDAVKRPENLSFHEGSRVFFATLPVKAGARSRQAWLHAAFICGPVSSQQELQVLRKRTPAEFSTAQECRGWETERIVGMATGRKTTGAEAMNEYYAMQKAAAISARAACTSRIPPSLPEGQRRGHALFSAVGLAYWGLLAHTLRNAGITDIKGAADELKHLRCWLRPRWISIEDYWDSDLLPSALFALGIPFPRTVFLDGRRLRLDPVHGRSYPFGVAKGPGGTGGDVQNFLDSPVPDDWSIQLSLRPRLPRRRRAWRIGRRRRDSPLPARQQAQADRNASAS